MKRSAILALVATASFAQVPVTAPAPVAAPAAAPAPVSYAAPATTAEAAPLAPVNARLLQGHPGAPLGIEDVLVSPHSSFGQKGVSFEWANPMATDFYVLWNHYFAAAQFVGRAVDTLITPAGTDLFDTSNRAVASFGMMQSNWGAGVSIAYKDRAIENAAGDKVTTYYKLNELKLFGSFDLGGKDLYGSLLWKKPATHMVATIDGEDYTGPRADSVLLGVGLRKAPPANAEGLAWNGATSLGYLYDRSVVGQKNCMTLIANLYGQLGYVFITDGITFLPGIDALLNFSNGPANQSVVEASDYSILYGASPYVAIELPLFEHWSLKGGARYLISQSIVDTRVGDPSVFDDTCVVSTATGNFGLRYERKRWAVEAEVGNGILSSGPYMISGAGAGDLFASLALTVNLK